MIEFLGCIIKAIISSALITILIISTIMLFSNEIFFELNNTLVYHITKKISSIYVFLIMILSLILLVFINSISNNDLCHISYSKEINIYTVVGIIALTSTFVWAIGASISISKIGAYLISDIIGSDVKYNYIHELRVFVKNMLYMLISYLIFTWSFKL